MVKLLFSKATCHYKTEWCLNLLVITLQQKWDENQQICALEDMLPIVEVH
jgi:hypothetical protein